MYLIKKNKSEPVQEIEERLSKKPQASYLSGRSRKQRDIVWFQWPQFVLPSHRISFLDIHWNHSET